jgi:hypothetical protein
MMLAVATSSACAQETLSPSQFVERLYDWYVPLTQGKSSGPAWNLVLTQEASSLDLELLRALRADSAAQSQTVGETTGVDFDPFLNTQDPCEHYEVGGLSRRGEVHVVDVHAVCSGTRSDRPVVAVEVVSHSGSWVIRNVRYPDTQGDLLAILGRLAEERHRRP